MFSTIAIVVAVALGAAFLTLVSMPPLVSLFMHIVGPRRVIEGDALIPTDLCLSAAILAGCGAGLAVHHEATGPLAGLALAGGAALVVTVWAMGRVWIGGLIHRRREFAVDGARLVRLSDGAPLAPCAVEQSTDYRQTDAFHGYSVYHLTLHDETGPLAHNGYVCADEKEEDLQRIFRLAPDCRSIDLVLVRRETPTRWMRLFLEPGWAPILCGSLSELSPDGRAWWRQWLLPRFPVDGLARAATEELALRLRELEQAYAPRIARDPRLMRELERMNEMARRATGPIEIMTRRRHLDFEKEALPERGYWRHVRGDELLMEHMPAAWKDSGKTG